MTAPRTGVLHTWET